MLGRARDPEQLATVLFLCSSNPAWDPNALLLSFLISASKKIGFTSSHLHNMKNTNRPPWLRTGRAVPRPARRKPDQAAEVGLLQHSTASA